MKTLAVVGGDQRQVELIKAFAADGYQVSVYGFSQVEFSENVIQSWDLSHTLANAAIVIGPVPCSHDNLHLFAKFNEPPILLKDVFSNIPGDALFFAGKLTPPLQTMLEEYKISAHDLLEIEALAVLNAIPTGEGAIQIAMENSGITLHGSKCLVLGYGRCGKVLAQMLKGIGADTTVAARKEYDQAYIRAFGMDAVSFTNLYEQYQSYDFIFNTVPSLVVDKALLALQKKSCLIIDLASAPGGVDFDAAGTMGITALLSLNLPGKVAPVTAARIIRDTVVSICNQNGVIL